MRVLFKFRKVYILHRNSIEMKEVSEIIKFFASKNIHIEILCDGFKLGEVCYRAYVHYKLIDEWKSSDIGCFHSWVTAFEEAQEHAAHHYHAG